MLLDKLITGASRSARNLHAEDLYCEVLYSLTGQTLFYLCVVTGAHIVYSRHGGSKEKVEVEEGKKSCLHFLGSLQECRQHQSDHAAINQFSILVTSLFIVT